LAGLSTTVQPAASAGDHRVREIPRRDRAADADRLLDRKQPRIRALGRNRLAIDATGLFGEKLDIGAADVDFAERFRERLALLGGEDQREVLAIGDDQVEPFAQDIGALLGGELGPGGKGTLGGFDRLRRFRRAHHRDLRKLDAIDRIGDGPRRRADPRAVDVAMLAQQRRVFQAERGACGLRSASGGGRGHGVAPKVVVAVERNIGSIQPQCTGTPARNNVQFGNYAAPLI
jgi:ParB family chromosome partitioning protein